MCPNVLMMLISCEIQGFYHKLMEIVQSKQLSSLTL